MDRSQIPDVVKNTAAEKLTEMLERRYGRKPERSFVEGLRDVVLDAVAPHVWIVADKENLVR